MVEHGVGGEEQQHAWNHHSSGSRRQDEEWSLLGTDRLVVVLATLIYEAAVPIYCYMQLCLVRLNKAYAYNASGFRQLV